MLTKCLYITYVNALTILADRFKLKEYVIYTYDISKLKPSNRVRFVYLLKGREKGKGLIDEIKGNFLAPGCFYVSIVHDEKIKFIFKEWNIHNFTREFIYKND